MGDNFYVNADNHYYWSKKYQRLQNYLNAEVDVVGWAQLGRAWKSDSCGVWECSVLAGCWWRCSYLV